jgi:hypothetical protein
MIAEAVLSEPPTGKSSADHHRARMRVPDQERRDRICHVTAPLDRQHVGLALEQRGPCARDHPGVLLEHTGAEELVRRSPDHQRRRRDPPAAGSRARRSPRPI